MAIAYRNISKDHVIICENIQQQTMILKKQKKQSTFIVNTKTLLQNIIFYLHIGMKVIQVWNNIGWENDDRVILRLLNNIIVLTDILTELLFFLFSFTILFVLVNLLCAFVILIHFFLNISIQL